ncbi:MAG TPA: response regulator transcription factor [Pyrinomonadaceae bacterium]|nr:response regulator transcription factor [Pyrinomonadaceae bacterium]
MKDLTIVIADDSPVVREHLKRALAQVEGCMLVGMAVDGVEAINMVRALKPDIVVLDIAMPHRSGIDALKEIRREDPEIVIIMFTADPSDVLRDVCLEAGANFYLDKSQLQELIDICEERYAVV